MVARIRHNCSKNVLLLFYNSHIRSIIEYGLLIYGCTSFNQLNPILILQKKIIRLMFFKKAW